MPQVTVKLYATLRRFVDGKPIVEAPIAPGDTVGRLLEKLGVPADEIRILFVNNRHATSDRPLADGDRVGVFPAIGGG